MTVNVSSYVCLVCLAWLYISLSLLSSLSPPSHPPSPSLPSHFPSPSPSFLPFLSPLSCHISLPPSSGSIQDGMLTIGNTQHPIKSPHSQAAIVPDILFYDNQLVQCVDTNTLCAVVSYLQSLNWAVEMRICSILCGRNFEKWGCSSSDEISCTMHFCIVMSYVPSYPIVGVLQVLTCFISAFAHTSRHAKGLHTGRAPPAGGQPGGPAVCATCTSNSTAAASVLLSGECRFNLSPHPRCPGCWEEQDC